MIALLALTSCSKEEAPTPTSSRGMDRNSVRVIPDGTLLWSEEFDGTSVDTSVWNFEIGDGCPNLCGWGNNERQSYTNSNTEVSSGTLKITAKKDSQGQYTSSRITTKGKYQFRYGRVEVRAKLPEGQGTWPAIWMLGSNIDTAGWPASGEIDIMEHGNRDAGYVSSAVHYGYDFEIRQYTVGGRQIQNETDWHVYRLDWQSDSLSFYVDDVLHHTDITRASFHQEFFLILNVAMGGTFTGNTIDPNFTSSAMEIDYIRVYNN